MAKNPSPETELRRVRHDLIATQHHMHSALGKLSSLEIGICRLRKIIGVNLSTMPADDPWRTHIEFWCAEMDAILKEARR